MRSHSYHIVGSSDTEESLFFVLNSLLQSRIDTGEETSDDEDVNMYLAGLVHSFVDRSFHRESADLVSSYDSEVHNRVEGCVDVRGRYRVYKSNGDYALMTSGIFDRPVYESRRRSYDVSKDDETTIERGKLYYRFAANLNARLGSRRSAVSIVLTKLSERFEMYVKILSHMRGDYLKLSGRLSDGELYHLQRDAHEAAKPALARAGMDRFLDAYSEWMRARTEESRAELNRLGHELAALDPEFNYEDV